jgi:hypothetical protein
MKFNTGKATNHILIGGDIRQDGTIGELHTGNKDQLAQFSSMMAVTDVRRS